MHEVKNYESIRQVIALFTDDQEGFVVTSGLTTDFETNIMSFRYRDSEGEHRATIQVTAGVTRPSKSEPYGYIRKGLEYIVLGMKSDDAYCVCQFPEIAENICRALNQSLPQKALDTGPAAT